MNVLGASAVACRDSRNCAQRVKEGGKGVEQVRITGSQDHRTAQVGGDLERSSGPNSCGKGSLAEII